MSESEIKKKEGGSGGDISLDSLRVEIDKLVHQVKKNTNAIVETGRHVLNIQIEQERGLLAKKGGSRKVKKDSDSDSDDNGNNEEGEGDNITSDDIVELVTELQGQLDMLDERSIRRSANAFVSKDEDPIAPLPGRDGEYPSEEENFPATLGDFKQLDSDQVTIWLQWYELLPPDEEELSKLLDKAGATLEDIGITEPIKKPEVTPELLKSNFDTLSRFLGLRERRTKGAW